MNFGQVSLEEFNEISNQMKCVFNCGLTEWKKSLFEKKLASQLLDERIVLEIFASIAIDSCVANLDPDGMESLPCMCVQVCHARNKHAMRTYVQTTCTITIRRPAFQRVRRRCRRRLLFSLVATRARLSVPVQIDNYLEQPLEML